jgi:4-hydroxy-3-polyprenylbenzoate decarboxylase
MDLPRFVAELLRRNELLVVDAPADPFLEIAALTDRMARDKGPALLFKPARAGGHCILTNALGSPRRLALAQNHDSIEDFGRTAHDLLRAWERPVTDRDPGLVSRDPGLVSRDPGLANRDPGLAQGLPIVDDTPLGRQCFSGTKAGLDRLPRMTLWPGDAGPCITAGVVITKHPETGQRNAGIYRLQILDRLSATLGWHPGSDAARHFQAAEKSGRALDVAVALGVPPAVLLAAGLSLPDGVDELAFAARITRRPLPLARCRSMDLLVPAASQFILEGQALPGERAQEGPFGNHTGLLSSPRDCPVFRLRALTQAADPVFPCIVAGPPPSESTWIAKAQEAILRVRILTAYPQIRNMAMPAEGIHQNIFCVAVAADCPDALGLLRALTVERELRRFRFFVAVDETVDCSDASRILWRMGNCLDPDRDMACIHGPLAPWHPSAHPGQGAKLLLDARAKHPARPMPHGHDPALVESVQQLWQTLRQR